jgi:hypothetical protein
LTLPMVAPYHWSRGTTPYSDTKGNIMLKAIPAPDPTTRDLGDDLPSVPVCPLHGPSCAMWNA